MAQLFQSQLLGAVSDDIFTTLPSRTATGADRPVPGSTYPYGTGAPRGVAYQCTQDGIYVAGEGWVRFTIVQPVPTASDDGPYHFEPGQIIQIINNGNPSSTNPLVDAGYIGIIVRNSKVNADDQNGTISYGAGTANNYQYRQLNDVVVRPLTGTSAEWTNICPSSFDRTQNFRILSRSGGTVQAYQANFGKELTFVNRFTIQPSSIGGVTRYNQGDGENNAFNYDYDLIAENGGGFSYTNIDMIHGRPMITGTGDPLVDRSNWVNTGTTEAPRYTAENRIRIEAKATADDAAFEPIFDEGGDVDCIGVDFINSVRQDRPSLNGHNQLIQIGRENLELEGDNITLITADPNAGAWRQDFTGTFGGGAANPRLIDILRSPAYFNIPNSELPVGLNGTVTTRNPVHMTWEASSGLINYTVPAGTALPVIRTSTYIEVNFSRVNPGVYADPISDRGPQNIQFHDFGNYLFSDCKFEMTRPGTDASHSALLEFNTQPLVNGADVILNSAHLDTRVAIPGRVEPGWYFDNVHIQGLNRKKDRPTFVIDDVPTEFVGAFRGLGATSMALSLPVVGHPDGSTLNHTIDLIDPVYNTLKPYAVGLSRLGDISVSRTLVGTISNGDSGIDNLNIRMSQIPDTNRKFRIDSNGGFITTPSTRIDDLPAYDETDERITLEAHENPDDPLVTHRYTIQTPTYSMPASSTQGDVEVDITGEWRVAVSDLTRVPQIHEVRIGGAIGSQSSAAAQNTAFGRAFQPVLVENEEFIEFPTDGIEGEVAGLGNIVLELDPFVSRTRDELVGFGAYDPMLTPGAETLADFYDALHGFSVTRTDGVNESLAGELLGRVNPTTRYIELDFDVDHALTMLSATTTLQSAYDPASTTPAMRFGFGPLGYRDDTSAARFLYRDRPFWATTPNNGADDLQGIEFIVSRRPINAEAFPWNIGVRNATLNNISQTGNSGTFENVRFNLTPGTQYTFDGAAFNGDLSQIIFESTDSNNPAEVFFQNVTLNGNTGQTVRSIENAATNVTFPDTRRVIFPGPGQAVFTLVDSSGGHTQIPDTLGNTTHHVVVNAQGETVPAEIAGAAFGTAQTLRVYFKPRDFVPVPRFPGDEADRIRYELNAVDFTLAGTGSNDEYTIDNTVYIPMTQEQTQGMNNDTFDQTPFERRDGSGNIIPLWSFDGANATDGAQLDINLYPTNQTDNGNAEYNLGQTKLFAYWWLERYDLQTPTGGSGRNYYLEAIASLGGRVNHINPADGGVPLRFELSQVVVNTFHLTLRVPNANDPLNTLSGLVAADQSDDPDEIYHINRSEARDDAGNIPGNTSFAERLYYLVDETRNGGVTGIPDIAVIPPQQGLTEFQAQRAATQALQLSQANNILHWVADGQSSKIPVGRAYDASVDYEAEG